MEGAARPAPRVRARDLVDATPGSRNRYLDLIRVVSIVIVVLGHWTLAVLGYSNGAFTGSNLLELDPDLQITTWAFQVMPLFFIVGGLTNAMSWRSARGRGTTYGAWLVQRSARLLRPAIWFVAFWTILPVLGVVLGLFPASMARIGGEEVSLPLWFLAVYLLAVAAAPPLVALHERSGIWTLVALGAGVIVNDMLRYGLDVGIVGALNYAFVWLAVLELGILWGEGTLRRRSWLPWAMAGGGLLTLIVLTGGFDYPISMIGLTHAPRSNAQPPTMALLVLGIWQCGVAMLFEAAGNRWLMRSRVWLAVVAGNSMVMTFYLWNMSAVVLAAVLLFPTGIAPQPEALSTAWWLLRPAWYLACAVCLVPFLLAFRWAERPAPSSPSVPEGWSGVAISLVGTIAASAGLAILAAQAFPVPDEKVALPALGVALVVAAALMLRVDPVAPLKRRPAERVG